MCKIIVMANQKGGVAKTSSTRNLAYSLAELGKKVLAVDFDPQTNLTISFGVAPAALQETAASLMMKLVMDEVLPEKASYILNIGKVDLLPSKKTLTVAEVNLLIERKDDCLAKLLAPLRADYDYILVDTGPSLGSLTINAFTAADEIIIPVDPELFALVGLKELTETISKIKQNLNPKVEIIGILFTKCSKRTTLYRQTSEQVRSVFGHLPIFESQIPATVQVGTANSKGLSVMELDAKSPAAAAYMNLAKEVLAYAYDTANAQGQASTILLPIKNLMNDSYSRDISVKIRSHLEVKKRKGQFVGAFAAYGYLKSPDDKNQLVVDDYAAEVVRDIFRWKLEGMSQQGIADRLNADGVLSPSEYGRVASPDTWALENQMNYLRSFAEKHQLNVVGESQDEASGLTFDRPGLNDFLEAVRQGRADALLTKDLTRLGRDVMQTASWIADLNTSGVGVFSVTDLTLRGL